MRILDQLYIAEVLNKECEPKLLVLFRHQEKFLSLLPLHPLLAGALQDSSNHQQRQFQGLSLPRLLHQKLEGSRPGKPFLIPLYLLDEPGGDVHQQLVGILLHFLPVPDCGQY